LDTLNVKTIQTGLNEGRGSDRQEMQVRHGWMPLSKTWGFGFSEKKHRSTTSNRIIQVYIN